MVNVDLIETLGGILGNRSKKLRNELFWSSAYSPYSTKRAGPILLVMMLAEVTEWRQPIYQISTLLLPPNATPKTYSFSFHPQGQNRL